MSNTAFEPAEIMAQQIFGLPVDRKTLFSNHKKVYKKRIEKRQRKLIIKLPFLKPFLKRGEHILMITTGYSPLASIAQYVTGFVFDLTPAVEEGVSDEEVAAITAAIAQHRNKNP